MLNAQSPSLTKNLTVLGRKGHLGQRHCHWDVTPGTPRAGDTAGSQSHTAGGTRAWGKTVEKSKLLKKIGILAKTGGTAWKILQVPEPCWEKEPHPHHPPFNKCPSTV